MDRKFPRSSRHESDEYRRIGPEQREEYESAVLSLLLHEHRSAQVYQLAVGLVGRLLSAVLVLRIGIGSGVSFAQAVSGGAAAVLIVVIWWLGRESAGRQMRGIEETLSRMTGGAAERAYIESRFVQKSRSSALDAALLIEPGLWLAAYLFALLVRG